MINLVERAYKIIVFLMVLMLVNPSANIVVASNSTWAQEQRVSGYTDETNPPIFALDQNQTVHAFVSQWVGDASPQLAIVYRQWTVQRGWTIPIDILLSPYLQARILGVFIDRAQVIHLIFYGGDQFGGAIFYSSAPASEADQVKAWSYPTLIGDNAVDPSSGYLSGDGNNTLVVVYSGNLAGSGCYFIYSNNAGMSWSEPVSISLVENNEGVPFSIQTYWGKGGFFHAVWNIVDATGRNIAAYYDRMDVTTMRWDNPVEFAKGMGINQGMGISNIALIEHQGTVFIFYNNGIPPDGVPPSQWLTTSYDNGKTWSPPFMPFPDYVGRSGESCFAVDSADDLHVFFAARVESTINEAYAARGGVWYSQLMQDQWSQPEPIISSLSLAGQASTPDPQKGSIGPYAIHAIISQGNHVLVTWRSDPGFANNGVWFSTAKLSSPELTAIGLPTVQSVSKTAIPTKTSVPLITATSQPSPVNTMPDEYKNPAAGNSSSSDLTRPTTPLLVGMLPVLVIIIIVTFLRHRHAR